MLDVFYVAYSFEEQYLRRRQSLYVHACLYFSPVCFPNPRHWIDIHWNICYTDYFKIFVSHQLFSIYPLYRGPSINFGNLLNQIKESGGSIGNFSLLAHQWVTSLNKLKHPNERIITRDNFTIVKSWNYSVLQNSIY